MSKLKRLGTRHQAPGTSIVFLFCLWSMVCGLWTHPAWAAKSLWELRGQTTGQESSQGETTQPEQKTATKTEPAQTAVQTTVKEAVPVNTEAASFVESITIPSQYGRVKERFAGSDNRVFILMQEIHNHPEVQKNNKEIMNVLLEQYQVPLILIEGNYGPITAEIFRAQKKEWRETFAKEQLETGYYTAEDYVYLTREIPPTVIGVDDERIVKEQYDLVHYKFLLDNRSKAEASFNPINDAIKIAKEKLYGPALKAFDGSAQEYAQDKISAEEFVTILKQVLEDHGMTLTELTYPNISLIIKGNAAEEKEDYEGSQEYLQKVDHSKLFGEIKMLEREIRSKWYKDTKEEKLDHLAKALYYLQKLSNISLIPLEWEEYIQDLHPFTIAELINFLKENNIPTTVANDDVAFLDQYRKEGETFYQIAIDRERTMVENSLTVLSQKKVNKAILKTGGFHTSGISQFLRTNGISYIVIAPRVTQPDMPTPYQELLKKTMDNLSKTLKGKPLVSIATQTQR